MSMMFHDRRVAGRALARRLREDCDCENAVVLALPRGGVPVAYEVARELGLALDVLTVRKLGVPGQEELAMGAVASGGVVVLNAAVVRGFGISRRVVESVVAREQREVERREAAYRGGRQQPDVAGRTAIVVDDGLATGATMKAAAHVLRARGARTVAAVPVGAASTCEELQQEVDQVVCLLRAEAFSAVGEFYRCFEPVSEEEVRKLLDEGTFPGRP